MKKVLNIALLITFIVSSLAPLTGVPIHKMASSLFLLLCIIHTIAYRRKLGAKRWLMVTILHDVFVPESFCLLPDEIRHEGRKPFDNAGFLLLDML